MLLVSGDTGQMRPASIRRLALPIARVLIVGSLMGAVRFSADPSGPARTPVVVGTRSTGLIIPSWEALGYQSREVATILDRMKSLGLQRVTFIVTWYQASRSDSSFGPMDATPTDASLRSAISQARSRGLAVALKPHIDLPDDTWRGDIVPEDRDAWFAAYRSFIARYTELAHTAGASTFVVGTELAGISTDPRWRTVIATVRAKFAGTLTYAANWDEFPQITFWDLLDEIGIDAYYPLTSRADGTASVAQLTDAWKAPKQSLRALAARWAKPVRFTEVGYTRHRGTTAAPWDFALATSEASEEQAKAYKAVFDALKGERWFAGPDFWAADPPAEEHDLLGYSPLGHPAETRLAAGAALLLG